MAASEKRPLPLPMSRKVLPARLGSSSMEESESHATAILSSAKCRKNRCQFFPKAKRDVEAGRTLPPLCMLMSAPAFYDESAGPENASGIERALIYHDSDFSHEI